MSPVQREPAPTVEVMWYSRVYRAAEAYELAIVGDPIKGYIDAADDTPPPSPSQFQNRVRLHALRILLVKPRRWTYTVGDVYAMLLATPPQSDGLLDKVLSWVASWFSPSGVEKAKSEKEKRIIEYRTKVRAVAEKSVGARYKDMVYLDGIATHPDHQRKGYADMLMEAVAAKIDTIGKAAFLVSSNSANEKFYQAHGFSTVGEAVIGDENPTWDEKPIVVQIMVREARPSHALDEAAVKKTA
ncbi:hypothetical protein HGRIS_013637 [Hohenbuehelia grisea]|uniref:N-acetyltransferase domain-containing protein n=1 Tax=Hohenbuehelia grisea TaxID=104357 RepID=A0ABR3IW60_9AGAR